MAQHYYMTPEDQAANVASAKELLEVVAAREVARGIRPQGEEFDRVSNLQSAITATMVAALEGGLPPAGMVHAIGFSIGTYFAQCDCVDEGLEALGRAMMRGVQACGPMMAEPAGRA